MKTKKKTSPKTKKIKKGKKPTLSPIIVNQVYAIILFSISAFLCIHSYVENQQSVIGLSLELLSLYTFGTIGFKLLPFCLILSGIISSLSVRKISTQLLFTSVLFISMAQLSFLMFFSDSEMPTMLMGYAGESISKTLVFLFGNIGSIIILLTGLISLLSINLNLAPMRTFKPFYLLAKSIGNFIKVLVLEIKKTSPSKSVQLKLIHMLFFKKVTTMQRKPMPKIDTQTDETIPEIASQPPQPDMSEFELNEPEDNSIDLSESDEIEPEKEIEEESEPTTELTETYTPPPLNSDAPTADVPPFILPPISLLKKGSPPKHSMKSLTKKRVEKAAILEEALTSFNVRAKVVNITPGPTVTRYELQPGEGVKISKITGLSKDISLKLAASDIRIEAPIPGKSLVGIEVPNEDTQTITLQSIIEEIIAKKFPTKLTAGLGKTITGDSIMMDLGKMPHVLIAGATGSGKSVCVNTIILSILLQATPDEVKFLMIDPKKVELSLYEGIPNLLAPVVTDPNKAAATLKRWALVEMENRYETFSKCGVKDLKGFNNYVSETLKENPEATLPNTEHPLKKMPYLVVIIDELADLMMVASQDVEQTICRLAQMARATGIHLVIATQRPSVNVITGLIKANIPSRISFYLQSQIDSRTILDMAGAEKLLGKGDMLYAPVGSFKPSRAQGVFVSEEEVKDVVKWLKKQGSPDYISELVDIEPLTDTQDKDTPSDTDELYEDAKQLIINTKYASTSFLQRKLRIGYNRAARIMDDLEANGVISEYVGDKKARSVG